MRLKRLELQGYKTFASKQEFLFDEGITAIVGPNGSGKSNVADALRWVLGEQSYSTLRGKRTTDMIFAGSQSRARAGMAQALLTLDNSGGWLPIDFSEVELGRRAFRSGENEYLLNGQRVRLRDITDLLATSGLAERNYTIIGQGLIDRALSLRAEERRALFEEAAGINHYKLRRAESLRRLDETQRNLERVQDILAEIRPRLNALRRQAGRAQNYEQIEADLRALLRQWYGYQWHQARERLRARRLEAIAAENVWRDGRRRLQAAEEALETEKRRVATWQSQERQKGRERDETRGRLEAARRHAAILAERSRLTDARLAELATELPGAIERREAAERELAQASEDLVAAQSELARLQKGLSRFSVTFATQQGEIRRWQQAAAEGDRALREAQQALAQKQGQLAQLRERLAEPAPDLPSTNGLQEELARADAEAGALRQQQADWRRERSAGQQHRRQLTDRLKARRQEGERTAVALNEARQAIARQEARRELLARLRRQEAPDLAATRLVGQLGAMLTIPEQHRRALEAALERRLATFVLPDGASLRMLLSGREQALSLIALDETPPPPARPTLAAPGMLGWADELVTCPPAIRPVARWLLGTTACARDAAAALDLAASLPPGYMAAAPDGLVAHPGGLIEIHPSESSAGVLAREEEWRRATEELARRQAAESELQSQAVANDRDIAAIQAELDDVDRQERERAAADAALAGRLGRAESQLERLRQQSRFAERQRAEAEAEAARLAARAARLESEIDELSASASRLEGAVVEARKKLDALPAAEIQQERQSWQQQLEAARTILSGRQAVVDSRRATLTQLEDQLNRLLARQGTLRQEQAALDMPAARAAVQAAEEALARLDMELAPLHASIQGSEETLAKLEGDGAALRRAAHDRETDYTQARIELSQQENQLNGLLDRIHADLGLVSLPYEEDETGQTPLPISEVVEQLPVVDALPADIEEEIQKYRAQLRRIGPINPEAPAEYAETQTRHDFLEQQVEDLEKTEHRLRAVIAELDQLTSTAFASTVASVDEVFGGMFRQLFGGGSARLVLTEPDDLTVSGVDIIARLPARREQGLGLLSGGERSLTATALIFALLKVAPTPFCVLDEVDAMLDEANVGRFVSALHELSERTQFIIITHNRGTVQAAHTVYGISMGADSASRVISVKPEAYVKRREEG